MKEQADWFTMANGQHDRFHKETEYQKTLVKVNWLFLALGTLENILVCLVMSRVYRREHLILVQSFPVSSSFILPSQI